MFFSFGHCFILIEIIIIIFRYVDRQESHCHNDHLCNSGDTKPSRCHVYLQIEQQPPHTNVCKVGKMEQLVC